jgi:hypothetical protein
MSKTARYARLIVLTSVSVNLLELPARAAEPAELTSVTWTSATCEVGARNPNTSSGLVAALLGLLLPKAVEGGLRLLGNAIARAGAPTDRHVWSQTSVSLYRVEFDDRTLNGVTTYGPTAKTELAHLCVSAAFGPRREPNSLIEMGGTVPLAPRGASLNPEAATLLDGHFDMARTTIVVAELEVAPDRTAFRFVPVYVNVRGALRDRQLDRSRAVAITFSILPPGGTADGAASVIRSFGFPQVSGSLTLSGPQARSRATTWIPLPGISDLVRARITAAATRRGDFNALEETARLSNRPDEVTRARFQQQRLAPLIASDNAYLASVGPYTIRSDLNETTPGSPFLVRLGELLAGNAGTIAEPISNAILPEQRAAAAEGAADEQDTLRIAAINETAALAGARATGNASAIRVAEIKAAAACRRLEAAGFSDPACILGP